MTVDDVELRQLVPHVLSVLVRRGADFATAEDAVQEALIRALSEWEGELPSDPTGWLITVALRAFLDRAGPLRKGRLVGPRWRRRRRPSASASRPGGPRTGAPRGRS
jgi:predicted RNA polymerase sigma factor